jgi:hypothetical protein
MSLPWQAELDRENIAAHMPFQITDKVRIPQGGIATVTEFDSGYLNVKVRIGHIATWFNDAELTKV